MPLSLAYAIWSGVGTALTVLVGIVIWHDIFTVYSAIGIALIIGGVILLNQGNKGEEVVDRNAKVADSGSKLMHRIRKSTDSRPKPGLGSAQNNRMERI